jgi:uncharacterized protein Veg
VWRVSEAMAKSIADDYIKPGDVVSVKTQNGRKRIIVTRVEKLEVPPVDLPIFKIYDKEVAQDGGSDNR